MMLDAIVIPVLVTAANPVNSRMPPRVLSAMVLRVTVMSWQAPDTWTAFQPPIIWLRVISTSDTATSVMPNSPSMSLSAMMMSFDPPRTSPPAMLIGEFWLSANVLSVKRALASGRKVKTPFPCWLAVTLTLLLST